MNKEQVIHIYNAILLSHKKNNIMLFWAIWMDVEIILCEVNKTERQISYDIMYMLSLIKIIEKAYL